MNPWWKIGIVLVWTIISFTTGWHIKTKFVEAAQLKAYQDQIDAANEAQQEVNDYAADLENDLADERQNAADLNSKLEKNLATHPEYSGCKLPADGVWLLNDAIAGNPAR